MQQTLRRLDGVASVKVDLLDGKVTMKIKPDSDFDPAAVLKLTYDSGVSVTEISAIATGHLIQQPDSGGGFLFEIARNVDYPIVPGTFAEKIQSAASSHAAIRMQGILYQRDSTKGKRIKKSKGEPAQLKFQVTEVM